MEGETLWQMIVRELLMTAARTIGEIVPNLIGAWIQRRYGLEPQDTHTEDATP